LGTRTKEKKKRRKEEKKKRRKEKSSNLYKPYTANSDDVVQKLTLHATPSP